METTDNRLLSGILEQADQKARKTLEEASVSAQRVQSEAQQRAEHEVDALRRDHEQKLKQVQLRLQSAMASAKRKASLRQIDESYQQVMRHVLAALDATKIASYLPQWIAEAALGLDLKEAKVSYSRQCPVTEDVLQKAADLVKKATGSEIALHLDPKPIRSLGVIVSSLDDTMSFNNQVEVRLRRFDRVIRSMIQEHT